VNIKAIILSFFSALLLILFTLPTFSQKSLNGNLISCLASLKKVDRFLRNEQTKLQNGESVSTNLSIDQIIAKANQI
jgi:hypothetical protein